MGFFDSFGSGFGIMPWHRSIHHYPPPIINPPVPPTPPPQPPHLVVPVVKQDVKIESVGEKPFYQQTPFLIAAAVGAGYFFMKKK
jgi:hypothetical protein